MNIHLKSTFLLVRLELTIFGFLHEFHKTDALTNLAIGDLLYNNISLN